MRSRGLGGAPLGAGSPLFGGKRDEGANAERDREAPRPPGADAPEEPRAGALGNDRKETERDSDAGEAGMPNAEQLVDLKRLLADPDRERSVDDWGRSESVVSAFDPLLNFYYRYWFRVEVQGIQNVPSEGGALLVSNHSGALPPDAPMVMQAIRNEHPEPRPLYMLGENWFRSYPGVSMLVNKLGLVPAHRANAQRLLGEEGRLAIAFPEGQKGTRKVYWQRYRLRRFGRGGFIRTAIRARVPIVPIALVGGEEAMPIFAHIRPLQKLTGLIYFPVTPTFPLFGLAASLMYTPAKFKIRFMEPVRTDEIPVETADDPAEVQAIAEQVRATIQFELDSMLESRRSVWFG